MRLLVASDSHGRVSSIMEMLERSHTRRFPADALLFLGDGVADLGYVAFDGLPVYPVKGNCDLHPFAAPSEETLTFDGYRILFMHGNRYGVKSGTDELIAYAAGKGADIVLYGHTHEPDESYYPAGSAFMGTVLKKPIYVLNPGSIGESRWGVKRGYAVLEIGEQGILWNRVDLE